MPRSRPRDLLVPFASIVITLIGFNAQVQAATFTMSDGAVVEGDIIDKMAGNFIIRSTIGYTVNNQINAIEAVVIRLRDGGTIRGALVDWENGNYVVRHEDDDTIMMIQRGADGDYLLQSLKTTERIQPAGKTAPTLVQQAAPEPVLPRSSTRTLTPEALPPVVTKHRQPTM